MEDDPVKRAVDAYWRAHPGASPADDPEFIRVANQTKPTSAGSQHDARPTNEFAADRTV